MGSKSSIVFPTFIFIFIVIAQAEVFDITKFGAKPDAEISKALCDAWSAACSATTPSKLLIPSGTFCLNVVEFKGPCKAPITVKIDGTLKGPEDPAVIPKGVQWITFSYVSALTITGCGTLDGAGGAIAWPMKDPVAWPASDPQKKSSVKKCSLQYNLCLNFIENAMISGITSKDSKMFHVNVMSCKNVTFDNFHICAPSESPNTDGIHLGWSKQITIKNSVIQTGDDCISIGDGCEELHIEGVKCGPGHGISVGSLGKNSGEKPVIGVYVVNCTFNQTMNGVRIKTWPDSHQGEVADLHFENLCMNQVENPIIVEQDYCPHSVCPKDKPSLVKVHDIFIKNVTGTATLPAVVNLKCSTANNGCENVKISDINLTYEGKEGPAFQECCNVKPVYSGKMIPPACSTADE
ncbi:polygalacturonase-like [Cynara cardunculus var. scolymus]|uniref:polygalacturonase-like n=1 Tax=Cynara cardunculus var. scolymus TaxID=59895 RepID=UPI000D626FDE|nr:polygalacturonase-like [Cynara cardunculus var. scolymus]